MPAATPNPSRSATRASAVVLVADDTRDTREMYAEYLAFCGYTVLTAADGDDVLRQAQQHRPDVVVLDLSMPHRDGWATARTLRANERTRRARIIAVSGQVFKGSEERAKAAGCDVYIAKPCLPGDLVAEIERQLRSKSAA
jgi:two-component system cell cycle response regulator DivK